jgi:DNA-binding beta-propeller fold protein YncE
MRRAAMVAALAITTIAGTTTAAAAPASPARRSAPGRVAALAASPARQHVAAGTTALWVAHYYGANKGAIASAITASPDGSTVFVAGDLTVGRHPHDHPVPVTLAYNAATGAKLWQTRYPAKQMSYFNSITVSPDGATVYAAGIAQATGRSPADYLTVAYNAATGAVRWANNSAAGGAVSSMAVSPDGGAVFVTGRFSLCGCVSIAAYNAASGTVLWVDHPAGLGSSPAIAVSPDSPAVFVTGSTGFSSDGKAYGEYSTTAYNESTGAALWTARYRIPRRNATPAAVAVNPDGAAVFVTGTAVAASGTSDYATVAYDPSTGAQLWARTLHSSKGASEARALAVSPDGSQVFVTGLTTAGPSPSAYGTVAYATGNGAARWVARYSGPATGRGGVAWGIAVSPNGSKVFVTGDSYSAAVSGQPQYATVAYLAGTGARSWTARYGGPKTASFAGAIAVSPDGSKVFVTGDTDGLHRMTTVAYSS